MGAMGISGRWWRGGAAVALVGAVAVTACTSEASTEPDSKRACARVNSEQMSDILDTKMVLQKAEKGSALCQYASDDGDYVVQLSVDGPVEKGLPKLLLTDPDKVGGVGTEAYISHRDTPLGTRMIVRDGGAMLTVDLAAPKRTRADRTALATEIAEAGVANLPEMDVKKAEGERGEEACEPFTSEKVAVAMGGVPRVTPSNPPGSCHLVVAADGLTVAVSALMETGATQDHLDGIVSAVKTAEAIKVGENAAYWIPQPEGAGNGGQLDVLDDGRLLQVAVIGGDGNAEESKAMAIAIASEAIAG